MPANPANLQRIFSSPAEITKRVDEALVKGLTKQFPIESRNYRVEVSNVRPEHTEVTNADEKEAILVNFAKISWMQETIAVDGLTGGNFIL